MKLLLPCFLLILISIVVKILGFLRQQIMASEMGIGEISDSYILAFSFPFLLGSSLAVGIYNTVIPIYAIKKQKGELEQYRNFILTFTIILLIPIILLCYIFIPQILKLIAFGFSNERLVLTNFFLKYFLLPGIFSFVYSYALKAIFESQGKVYIYSFIGIPLNIFIILGFYYYGLYGKNINYIIVGNILGFISQPILMLIYYIKLNGKINIFFNKEYFKETLFPMIPIVGATIAGQVGYIVDRSIASTLNLGSISYLNYSYILEDSIVGIFSMCLSAIIFPKLAKFKVENKEVEYKKTINLTVKWIQIFLIPCVIFVYYNSEIIINLIFKRGEFGVEDVIKTSITLRMYFIGIVFVVLRDFYNKILYIEKKSKVCMVINIVAIAINIVASLYLSKKYSFYGIALATSISYIISYFFTLNIIINKQIIHSIKKLTIEQIKLLILSIITFFLCDLGIRELSEYKKLFINCICLILIYGIIFIRIILKGKKI